MSQRELPTDKMPLALRRIAHWRAAPADLVRCPVCETPGLQIVDQSARPYAEWYALTCPACGLNATINIPLGPQVPGSEI
jgi:hypothetical protein